MIINMIGAIIIRIKGDRRNQDLTVLLDLPLLQINKPVTKIV